MSIDQWALLHQIIEQDLEYWKQQEANTVLVQGDEGAIKVALSVIINNIGIIEYYLATMDRIQGTPKSAD